MEITFIRHGETIANAEGVWQGHGDAPLSARGVEQSEALGERLAAEDFDLVLSSDLVRARQTATIAGFQAEEDAAWREMDIGAWEGMTRDEVVARHSDELDAIAAGKDVPMGGGESWADFAARIDGALADLRERVFDDARVAIVAHGGVIHAFLSGLLGFRGSRPWPLETIHNTAITTVELDEGGGRLTTLNDATHTAWELRPTSVGALVTLVRHGESEANVVGRWQGRTDGALTPRGMAQGGELARWYDGIDHVYSSPLARARVTAEAFAAAHGIEGVVIRDDLVEMDLGAWEDLTTDEIRDNHAELFRKVFDEGEDLPRGGSGETIADTAARIWAAVEDVVARHPRGGAALFTHGGAIWSLAAHIMELGWKARGRLAMPSNVGVTHIRAAPGGPVLVDYNIPG